METFSRVRLFPPVIARCTLKAGSENDEKRRKWDWLIELQPNCSLCRMPCLFFCTFLSLPFVSGQALSIIVTAKRGWTIKCIIFTDTSVSVILIVKAAFVGEIKKGHYVLLWLSELGMWNRVRVHLRMHADGVYDAIYIQIRCVAKRACVYMARWTHQCSHHILYVNHMHTWMDAVNLIFTASVLLLL